MKKFDKKFIFILSLIFIAGGISWYSYLKEYTQKDTVNIHDFPKTIGAWQSEELTITEDEYAILETKNAFARRYFQDSGKEVYLFIVYSQHNRKVSHPPELCYTGSGMTLKNNTLEEIQLDRYNTVLKAHKLNLDQKNFDQIAY